MKKALLVIDVQKDFKDANGIYEKTVRYINENKDQYFQIVATLFKNHEKSMFVKHLDWKDCFEFKSDKDNLYETHFLCLKDTYGLPRLKETLSPNGDFLEQFKLYDCVEIIGCELDACIMAVCFQLWDAGIDFKVLTDYCWTNNKETRRETIIDLLKRQFGDCIC